MFSAMENQEMHPSFMRLLACAKEATADTRTPIHDIRDLRRVMNESSATFTNWKGMERGVSAQGARKAEELFGCSDSYILEGKLPQWIKPPSAKQSSSKELTLADGQNRPYEGHSTGSNWTIPSTSENRGFTDRIPDGTTRISAPAIEWADVEVGLMKLNREWPAEARVIFTAVTPQVSDFVKSLVVPESKISTIAPGDCIAVDPKAKPWDDCVVLVRLKSGRHELFRYRALAGDGWEAVIPGEHPLDSERHGLTLMGVVVGLNKLRF